MSTQWRAFARFSWIAAVLLAAGLTLTLSLQSLADGSADDQKLLQATSIMVAHKCGSCHTLAAAGLEWDSTIGPDLTHQATRGRSRRWLRLHLKNPGATPDAELEDRFRGKRKLMPSFDHLSERELESVIHFLATLR